ncbi:MAG: DUF86 domain-containing protein [Chitinophagales bacterium]|nr:DUF86 domain-containing protein [Chitinophagales bacterium]
MRDEVKRYLEDALHSIGRIEKFQNTVKCFEEYEQNEMVKSAVQWRLSVIGEALSNALREEPALKITNSRRVVDMRNKLIHGYDEVEDNVVWNVLVKHLPLLKNEVTILLNA